MQRRLTRAEVPVAETWDLSDLFPTAAAWAAALAALDADLPQLARYRGRLGEGPAVLLDCLDAWEQLQVQLLRVFAYASLRQSEDGTDPDNQAAADRAGALQARFQAHAAAVRSEILALPAGTVAGWLAAEPALAPHRRLLERILAEQPYTLAPETEQALAALGEVLNAPRVIYNRAKLADMQFAPVPDRDGNPVPVSYALFESRYEFSPDTELRRRAYAAFVAGLRQYRNTQAATLSAEVKKHVVLARLRGYESTVQMLLQPQEVTPAFHDMIINVIQAELAPHMRRYARLRRRVLGLDRVMFCDLKAPMDPGYNPEISRAEASAMVTAALAVLGPEYGRIITDSLSRRWVDWADNVGKSTGAFCNTVYGVHPYILITWTGTMRSAFTLAHELGHAGHLALAMQYQRPFNHRPALCFIEAPSTMNEMLLKDHILARTTEPRLRRWVITQLLQTYHHNFITHLLEAELQRRLIALAEAGTPLTAGVLSEQKGDILTRFWGDTVEIDEGARLTWARQPHYYSGLYPYTYAAGLTVSTAAAAAIRAEGQPAVDRWLEVLKAGGTLPPLELARRAGVDLSGPAPVRQAVAYVGTLIDELEQSFGHPTAG